MKKYPKVNNIDLYESDGVADEPLTTRRGLLNNNLHNVEVHD